MVQFVILLILSLTLLACNSRNTSPRQSAAGGEESTKTKALEAGANALQSTTPLNQIGIYLVGFHPMKDDPSHQMEAHHYCNQMNEDFAQCVLFDGNTKDAHMNGIEYIISEKVFQSLPTAEKKFWHPHNYEVLSGELVAPGLPDAAEHSLMAQKMNSYGKTWHVWMTDDKGRPMDKLPMGAPHLAWSFNHDGEMVPGMMENRDKRMNIDSGGKRRARADLAQFAHPQQGVNDLKKSFPNSDGAPAGVQDMGEANSR